jgi:iron complex outermembrane receptor protein
MREHRVGLQNFFGTALGIEGALRRNEDNEVWNLDPYLQGVWKFASRWTLTAGVRHSQGRFSSTDRYIAGSNGDDSGAVRYGATLPVAGLMFAVSPQLHLYGALGRGFETPTFNELAYRPDGTSGLNFALQPSRSDNLEVGIKARRSEEGRLRSEWSAALFETRTRSEIVTQTNTGGRSTFQNASTTRRRGLEMAWSATLARAWQVQLAQTWLDARYRDAFATCSTTPCAVPVVLVQADKHIPGTAQSTSALDIGWQPEKGWRAGAELRRSSRVWVNDINSEAAPSFTTLGLHAGYVFDLKRWMLAATARIDNALDRRYAGSVIVNEGNARFYEPVPGRGYVMKLSGNYGF